MGRSAGAAVDDLGHFAAEPHLRQSIGVAWRTLGAYDRAERQLAAAAEAFRDEAPGSIDALKASEQLASVKSATGLFDEADVLLADVIRGKRALLGDRHDEVRLSEKNLAALRHHQGRLDEAEAMLNRLVTVYAEDPHGELRMAELLSMLAVMRRGRGDLAHTRRF